MNFPLWLCSFYSPHNYLCHFSFEHCEICPRGACLRMCAAIPSLDYSMFKTLCNSWPLTQPLGTTRKASSRRPLLEEYTLISLHVHIRRDLTNRHHPLPNTNHCQVAECFQVVCSPHEEFTVLGYRTISVCITIVNWHEVEQLYKDFH